MFASSSMFNLSKFIPRDLLVDSNSSINIDIMNFLSIDCSSNIGSLFIKNKSKTFSKNLQNDKFNNDLLMKQILDFLDKCKIKLDEISNIFVNQGPGNFSGLRGSLAVAKGISLSKNISLYGYNTFLLSCAKFFNKKENIYCFIKFNNKYFLKRFQKNLQSNIKAEEIKEDEIIEKYGNKFIVIPKNFAEYFDKKIIKLDNVNMADLNHNDLEFLRLKGLLDEELIKPLYLS